MTARKKLPLRAKRRLENRILPRPESFQFSLLGQLGRSIGPELPLGKLRFEPKNPGEGEQKAQSEKGGRRQRRHLDHQAFRRQLEGAGVAAGFAVAVAVEQATLAALVGGFAYSGPKSMAGLPRTRARVRVRPPFQSSGARPRRATLTRSVGSWSTQVSWAFEVAAEGGRCATLEVRAGALDDQLRKRRSAVPLNSRSKAEPGKASLPATVGLMTSNSLSPSMEIPPPMPATLPVTVEVHQRYSHG